MTALALVVMALLACVLLFLFWPLLLMGVVSWLCAAAGMQVLARIPRVRALLARSVVARVAVTMALWTVSVALGLAAMLLLPDTAYAPGLLSMVGGAFAAMLIFVAVWALGQGVTVLQQWHRKLPAGDRLPPEGWWIGSGVSGLVVFLLVAIASPDQAGWIAWREQLMGYPAVQLRIPLAAESGAQRTRHEQALLQLMQPLLEQGSRSVERSMTTKHGTSHYQATIPARYRWQGDTLEVVLAGRMHPAELAPHLRGLQWLHTATDSVGEAQLLGWSLAQSECMSRRQGLERALGLGRSRAQLAQARDCMQARIAQWAELGPLLAGKVGSVQEELLPRFSPWRSMQRWMVPVLPASPDIDARAR